MRCALGFHILRVFELVLDAKFAGEGDEQLTQFSQRISRPERVITLGKIDLEENKTLNDQFGTVEFLLNSCPAFVWNVSEGHAYCKNIYDDPEDWRKKENFLEILKENPDNLPFAHLFLHPDNFSETFHSLKSDQERLELCYSVLPNERMRPLVWKESFFSPNGNLKALGELVLDKMLTTDISVVLSRR